ncbi:MAG: hypothetical protein GXO23_06995 [Crenarchaeota archaeon]|nr:hypothetical protein [Thermoproteota archaeon]
MAGRLQLPVQDIKDLAITSLLVASHIAMGGETTSSIIELAADLAARFAVESGIVEDTRDLKKLLDSVTRALTQSKIKTADAVELSYSNRELVAKIQNCVFKGLCNCVMMRWDVYEQMFGKRPCPVASFLKYLFEHQLDKRMDIAGVECRDGMGVLKLVEI